MKRFIIITLTALALAASCQRPVDPMENLLTLPEGAVLLQDTEFGMYYGDLDNNGLGVITLVLSDARCYQDKIGSPYLDSEGDMVVLQLNTAPFADDAEVVLPVGEYVVSAKDSLNTVSATTSYVTRLVGNTQSKWAVKSGTLVVAKDENGEYAISTKDFVIAKGNEDQKVDYVCFSSIKVGDYVSMIPSLLSTKDDLINVPYPYVNCIYYYGVATTSRTMVMSSTQQFSPA